VCVCVCVCAEDGSDLHLHQIEQNMCMHVH
jgi:hypothetical protein